MYLPSMGHVVLQPHVCLRGGGVVGNTVIGALVADCMSPSMIVAFHHWRVPLSDENLSYFSIRLFY